MNSFHKSNDRSSDIKLSFFDTFTDWLYNLPQDVDYLFVRVRKKDKAPDLNTAVFDKETGFLLPGHKSITRDAGVARSWLEQGYNVGVYGYRGPDKERSIVLLDFDVKKGLPPDTVSGELVADYTTVLEWAIENNAYVQETRSGGIQAFFVNDGSIENGLITVYGEHAGECRAYNQYVVLSGSYVDPFSESDREKGKFPIKGADGYYKPIHTGFPTEISRELLPEWIQIETKSDTTAKKQAAELETKIVATISVQQSRRGKAAGYVNEFGTSLDEIRSRDKKLDRYLQNTEPKGYRSEADMGTTYKLWFWRFDDVSIANILRDYRGHEKMARPDYVATMIAKAHVNGLQFVPKSRSPVKAEEVAAAEHTDIETVSMKDLPDTTEMLEKLYGEEYRYALISGPPRKGKTRGVTTLATETDLGINYITNNHTIIGQFVRIRRELLKNEHLPRDKKLVWLSGKARNCKLLREKSGSYPCSSCPYYGVNDFETYQAFHTDVFTVASKLHTMTTQSVSEYMVDRCPYYLIKHAEKEPGVDICCTVPYFITTKDRRQRIQQRDITIIDEDPTVSHFYPDCVELASYNHRTGAFENNLDSKIRKIAKIKERLKLTDGGSEKKVYSSVDKAILEIIDKLEKINDALNDFSNTPRGEKVPIEGKPVGITMKELETVIEDITITIESVDTTDAVAKMKIIDRVEKYEHDIPKRDDDSTVTNIFESFLFSFEPLPIDWQGNRAIKKLYLIGDRSKLIRVPDFDKMVSIGFTNSELFIQDLQKYRPGKAIKFDVTDFSFDKNFVVVRVAGETKSDQTNLLKSFMAYTHAKNTGKNEEEKLVSSLVLTASEDKQRKIHDRFKRQISSLRQEDIDGISRIYYNGGFMVFYTNSTISRGVDVDMFDTIFVYDTNYAMPYYEAAMKIALKNNDMDGYRNLRVVRDSLVTDEVTNSILRICNVPGENEDQSKFVVITATDFEKIHQKVSGGMTVFDLYDTQQFDVVYNAILQNSRGFGSQFEKISIAEGRAGAFIDHIPGGDWKEAKCDFGEISKMKLEEFIPEKDAIRKRRQGKKIDDVIMAYMRSHPEGTKSSKSAIIKEIRRRTKNDSLHQSTIERRLKLLTLEGKLYSYPPDSKNKVYYSLFERPKG